MHDQSSSSAQTTNAQYVMRRSASSAPGIVANLTAVPPAINPRYTSHQWGMGETVPSIWTLARAQHTRERGAVQLLIIVP